MLKYYKIKGEGNFGGEISRKDLEIVFEWSNLRISPLKFSSQNFLNKKLIASHKILFPSFIIFNVNILKIINKNAKKRLQKNDGKEYLNQ
mgnify:CR=1 FL=1